MRSHSRGILWPEPWLAGLRDFAGAAPRRRDLRLPASVTFVAGLLLGDLAQPDAFSPTNDNISDIGAQTADQAWVYNRIAANLNGLLIFAFALGLWRALGSGWLARLGVLRLAVLGATRFLEGFLRLDCERSPN